MTVKNYRELIVWQKAMKLVTSIYKISQQFPKEEIYGLTSQIRRAAVSIPSNIAEGQARQSTKEFLHFLSIAQGSRAEVETQILIAQRLEYIDESNSTIIINQLEELARILYGLTKSLKN